MHTSMWWLYGASCDHLKSKCLHINTQYALTLHCKPSNAWCHVRWHEIIFLFLWVLCWGRKKRLKSHTMPIYNWWRSQGNLENKWNGAIKLMYVPTGMSHNGKITISIVWSSSTPYVITLAKKTLTSHSNCEMCWLEPSIFSFHTQKSLCKLQNYLLRSQQCHLPKTDSPCT